MRRAAAKTGGRRSQDVAKPRPLPQTRKGKLRREELKRVTAELLKTNSYQDLTLEKITSTAEMPLSVFYHYFNTKLDLVLELIDEVFVEFRKNITQAGPFGTFENGLRHAQLALLNIYDANTGLIRCLYEVEDPAFSRRWRELVTEWRGNVAETLGQEFAAEGRKDPDELFGIISALDGMTLEFAYQLVVVGNERLKRGFPDLEVAADFLSALSMRALFLKHPTRLVERFQTLQGLQDYDTLAHSPSKA